VCTILNHADVDVGNVFNRLKAVIGNQSERVVPCTVKIPFQSSQDVSLETSSEKYHSSHQSDVALETDLDEPGRRSLTQSCVCVCV